MKETRSYEIVVAEDNPADLALVRAALKQHKNRVLHVVPDGEKALTMIDGLDTRPKAPRIDLLLLDMHLPKHDGEEILERLRSTEHLAQTPAIATTSLDSSWVEAKTVRHAPVFYFHKASTVDGFMEFGAVVRRVLAPNDSSKAATSARNQRKDDRG